MLHSAPARRRGLEDCVRRIVCVSEYCFPLQSSPVCAEKDGWQANRKHRNKRAREWICEHIRRIRNWATKFCKWPKQSKLKWRQTNTTDNMHIMIKSKTQVHHLHALCIILQCVMAHHAKLEEKHRPCRHVPAVWPDLQMHLLFFLSALQLFSYWPHYSNVTVGLFRVWKREIYCQISLTTDWCCIALVISCVIFFPLILINIYRYLFYLRYITLYVFVLLCISLTSLSQQFTK